MSKLLGNNGEQLASTYLQERGYRILEHNWRCVHGEADLIAIHNQELVIVEVKTRRGSHAHENGLAAITPNKQARLYAIAETYHAKLEQNDLGVRVDVVIVAITPDKTFINIYENAVGW